MAEYFSLQGLDTPDTSTKGLLFQMPSPFQYAKQLENQGMAKQYVQQALANQQFDANKAAYEFDKTRAADTRLQEVMSDPRYNALYKQSILNELGAKGAKSGQEIIDANLAGSDSVLAPLLQAAGKDRAQQMIAKQAGGNILNNYGMDILTGLTPDQAMALNSRYRNNQEFKGKENLQKNEIDFNRWKAEGDWANQLALAKLAAASRASSSGGSAIPKTVDAAWIRQFVGVNGRLPNAQEIAAFKSQFPQFNPNIQQDVAGGKQTGKGQADINNMLDLISRFKGGGSVSAQVPVRPNAVIPQTKPSVIKLD